MTTIVNIDGLLAEAPSSGSGVRRPLVATDGTTMQPTIWRLEPGAATGTKLSENSDGYWFVIHGAGTISENGKSQFLQANVFAIAQQGAEIEVRNTTDLPLELLHIVSPPPGSAANISGYQGPLKLVPAESVVLVHEHENKKRRAHFVGPKAIPSGRADGMIVHYEGETVTPPHFHPDADSIFVILEGALEFTKGREVSTIRPGQAVFINQGHRHGTRVTPGFATASFLEFHVPAKFQTVQDP